MATTTVLEAAYRATSYCVFLPHGALALRIGQPSPGLADWLVQEGESSFAILTAWNPGSRDQGAEANRVAQSELECALLEAGYEPWAGENQPDDPAAPREETCLVTAISEEEARAWGAKYGQNAVVWGGATGVPQLLWIAG